MGGKGKVSEMIQILKEIVNFYDSEIYSMLVECHMDPNETVIRLISQDPFQEVKSKRNKKKDTKDQAESSRGRIPYHGARNSAKDSYNNAARGGGIKFNSNDTRLAQSVPANRRGNYWAGSSSSAPSVRPPPANSDPKNAEVKKAAPTGSTGAASSSLLPAPAYQSAWVNANPGKKTMAEIVKMGKSRSSEMQEIGRKAPLKDEGSSTEKKQDVSDPVSSLLKPAAESNTHAEQVSEPQQVDESQMDDEVPETKTNPVEFHPDVDQVSQCSDMRFGRYGFNYNSENTQETEEDSSFRHLFNSLIGEQEEQVEDLGDNATDEQTSYQTNSAASNYHASSDYETVTPVAPHAESTQEDPQMQNIESILTNDQRDASISPPGAGQEAAALYEHPASNLYFHRDGMPSRHHGDFISDPFMPHGYMHSGFQQGFPVGDNQAPHGVVFPPYAPSLQYQNEISAIWAQVNRPYLCAAPGGEVYLYNARTGEHRHSFMLAEQLYLQQLSQLTAMSMDRVHHPHQHHYYHHYHHQQSGGEAFSQTRDWTREQPWPNNN